MERFDIYQELVALYRAREAETDEGQRAILRVRILAAEREMALLEASTAGANLAGSLPSGCDILELDRHFRDRFEISGRAYMLLDPRAGLHIVDVNNSYASVTMVNRGAVAGQRLFDVFPDNSGDPALA